ncbi:hypothetical protein [Marinobacterium aestuariivivens]|uniref:Uncharacterized protein n=1 Tax=Marinobacterium aestuariivivens TaxID=1698799 RepID=A0ABW2A9N2_9GAMM
MIEEGNSTDSDRFIPLLEQLIDIYACASQASGRRLRLRQQRQCAAGQRQKRKGFVLSQKEEAEGRAGDEDGGICVSIKRRLFFIKNPSNSTNVILL